MVMRPYLTRLALGRSAFEPPEEVYQSPPTTDATSTNTGAYVQRYDERGYPINPESTATARRLREAQNEVLAITGVCVPKDQDPREFFRDKPKQTRAMRDREKIDRVVMENEIGLFVSTMDLGLMFACLWWTGALTARLQTFTFYDGIPFREILRIERKHWGVWKLVFVGMPAWVVSSLINMFREYLLDEVIDWIWDMLFHEIKDRKTRRYLRSAKAKLCINLNYIFHGLAIPLQLFSYLQVLGLISGSVLNVPSARSFIPFMSESPIHFPTWTTTFTAKALLTFSTDLLCSPTILHLVSLQGREWVSHFVYSYLREQFPKPDNPDFLSIEASKEDDLDSSSIPGIGWTSPGPEAEPSIVVSLFDRLFQFFDSAFERFGLDKYLNKRVPSEDPHDHRGTSNQAREMLAELWGAERTRLENQNAGSSSTGAPATSEASQRNHDPTVAHSGSSSTTPSPFSSQQLFNLDEVFSNAGPLRPEIAPLPALPNATEAPSPPTRLRRTLTLASATNIPASPLVAPPRSPHDVMGDLAHDPETAAAVLPPRRSDEAIQAEVEAEEEFWRSRDADTNPALNANETEIRPRNLPDHQAEPTSYNQPRPKSHHRVTAFSNHPPVSLASHSAALISNIIFLPLDALLFRSLALSYLSTPASVNNPVAIGLRHDVRELGNWFGSKGSRWDYAGKIGLALGLQFGMSGFMWLGGTQLVMWMGRRWFGWGRL